MRAPSVLLALLLFSSPVVFAQTTSPIHHPTPKFVEKANIDWDHSGIPTSFTLYFQEGTGGFGDSDRLVIRRPGGKPWILLNHDDKWAPLKTTMIPPALLRKNLSPSKRMLFISAGPQSDARTYLILKGGGYGCCVGSLTVITPGKDGTPKVVFHAAEHLLSNILPFPGGNGIELIGQPSLAEALADKNAASYDPFQIYVLQGDAPARYDLGASKTYNLEHYCEWVGPKYNEKFIAVNIVSGRFGAKYCRAMTEKQFGAYYQKHPGLFR